MKTIEPANITKTYPQMIRDRVISLHRRNFPALIIAFMLLVRVHAVCRWVERMNSPERKGWRPKNAADLSGQEESSLLDRKKTLKKVF
jgi:hypothetical protein